MDATSYKTQSKTPSTENRQIGINVNPKSSTFFTPTLFNAQVSSQKHQNPAKMMINSNPPLSPPPPPPQTTQLHGGDQQNHHHHHQKPTTTTVTKSTKNKAYMLLLAINYMCLFVGSVSSSLLSKFYFNHKGSSRWVSTWVQCAGFPLLILPIYLPFYLFKSTQRKPFSNFTPKLFLLSLIIGFFLGLNNLLFSWGNSYLPVSTSSLLISSQLTFNLMLSVLIVKQKITFSNLNCVVLLTLSSVLIALNSSHDKPPGLSRRKYFIGYFCTIGAGLLFALYLPVMEKVYKKVYCYAMVMEMQLVMEIAATALATVGMASDGGFSEMRRESSQVFDRGQGVYWVTVVSNVVTWQLCFMGTAGMVFLTSGLTGGICMTALMAMNVLGGVIVYGDEFGGGKVVSTVLCGWGFCSYVYGLYVQSREERENEEVGNGGGGGHDYQVQRLEMIEIVTGG